MKRFLETGRLDPIWVDRFCRGDYRRCVRYRMESRGEPHPDHMLPDGTLDESLLG